MYLAITTGNSLYMKKAFGPKIKIIFTEITVDILAYYMCIIMQEPQKKLTRKLKTLTLSVQHHYGLLVLYIMVYVLNKPTNEEV